MWLLWILPLTASFLLPATGEVVQSLSNCNRFFLNNVPPNLLLNNVAIICQKYKNKYRFVTMYDKHWRIPIFSAYKLRHHTSGQRRDNWKIEPQLATPEPEMASERSRINYDLLVDSQAVLNDYANPSAFDKGHLAPVFHQSTQRSMDATFTLTNTVPMDATLNRGQWKKYEADIKTNTSSCVSTYAIVGVIPGTTPPLNNRVNISSHIWAAICCVDQNQAKTSSAFIAANNNRNQVNSITLRNLENVLSNMYGINNIKLFNGAC